MLVGKVGGSDFERIVLDSDNYEGGINQIEIPRERADRRSNDLTEEEQATFRLELGKLMWIERTARPGAIYDASAAARKFPGGKMADSKEGNGDFSKFGEKGGVLRRMDGVISNTCRVSKRF